jgi:hypothetical protein
VPQKTSPNSSTPSSEATKLKMERRRGGKWLTIASVSSMPPLRMA